MILTALLADIVVVIESESKANRVPDILHFRVSIEHKTAALPLMRLTRDLHFGKKAEERGQFLYKLIGVRLLSYTSIFFSAK